MEEQGEVSYWSILFSSDDFSDLLDNAMMVEEIMDYDNQVMNELTAIREQIEADKTALETARQEQKDAKGAYIRRERRYGSFSRSLISPASMKAPLPPLTTTDILELNLPKAVPVVPESRRIAID